MQYIVHTKIVHTVMKKNITLSADPELIQAARAAANKESRTLNDAFREWLAEYGARFQASSDYEALMNKLSYAKPKKKFSRDEMNER